MCTFLLAAWDLDVHSWVRKEVFRISSSLNKCEIRASTKSRFLIQSGKLLCSMDIFRLKSVKVIDGEK